MKTLRVSALQKGWWKVKHEKTDIERVIDLIKVTDSFSAALKQLRYIKKMELENREKKK